MDTSRMMNQPTAAEGLVSGHDPRSIVVLPSTAVPASATLPAPIAPLPPAYSGSQGHIAAPINPSPSFSSGSGAVDYVDLTATPNVLRTPANSGNANNEPVGEDGSRQSFTEANDFGDVCRKGRSAAGDAESIRWTAESVTAMLEAIQHLRVKYDNGAGGYKQGIWRSIKERLEKAGHIRSAKQIQNKFAHLKKRWHERKTLLAISGFGIDPSTKRITASNECWEDLKNTGRKALLWHRDNHLPCFDLCEDVFEQSRVATGEYSVSLNDIEASDLFSDDDISPEVCETENTGNDDGKPARKRSATMQDPKNDTRSKKPHPVEALCSQMAEAVSAFREPVRISDSKEQWLSQAMDIWKNEFQGVNFAVQHVMYGNWSQSVQDAQIFVQASRGYRQWLVEKIERDLGLDDRAEHISAAGKEE